MNVISYVSLSFLTLSHIIRNTFTATSYPHPRDREIVAKTVSLRDKPSDFKGLHVLRNNVICRKLGNTKQ